MGGMTRLKGMGMFMAATWLGPALIMPIWSWVWKYMFEGRPVRHNMSGRCHTTQSPPPAGRPTAETSVLSSPCCLSQRLLQCSDSTVTCCRISQHVLPTPRQPPEAGVCEGTSSPGGF